MNIAPEEMPREIARLEEENERLKNKVEELDAKWINSLQQEEEYEEWSIELQERIDKALSKLEEIVLYDEYITIHTDFINNTKEILKGE